MALSVPLSQNIQILISGAHDIAPRLIDEPPLAFDLDAGETGGEGGDVGKGVVMREGFMTRRREEAPAVLCLDGKEAFSCFRYSEVEGRGEARSIFARDAPFVLFLISEKTTAQGSDLLIGEWQKLVTVFHGEEAPFLVFVFGEKYAVFLIGEETGIDGMSDVGAFAVDPAIAAVFRKEDAFSSGGEDAVIGGAGDDFSALVDVAALLVMDVTGSSSYRPGYQMGRPIPHPQPHG